MFVTIRYRRGTAAHWFSTNPTLDDGEPGYESDTRRIKIGDGVKAWRVLPYINTDQVNLPDNASVYVQSTPLATWTIPNPFERLPAVSLYVNGESVETDVTATTTFITITWPYPVAGVAVIN